MTTASPALQPAAIFGGDPTLPEIAALSALKRFRIPRPLGELVSTATVAMLAAFPRHDPAKGPLRAFLLTAASHAILDEERIRMRVAKYERRTLENDGSVMGTKAAAAEDLESLLASEASDAPVSARGELAGLFARVTRAAERVVRMHLVAKLTFVEIAAALGCSERTARTRFHEAISALHAVSVEQGGVRHLGPTAARRRAAGGRGARKTL